MARHPHSSLLLQKCLGGLLWVYARTVGRGGSDAEMAGVSRRRAIETVIVDSIGDGSAVNFDGAVRQPFAYHAESRRLYVGHPGMHHGEISFTKQWPERLDFDACYQGEIQPHALRSSAPLRDPVR